MLTRATHIGEGRFQFVDFRRTEDGTGLEPVPAGLENGDGASPHAVTSSFLFGAVASCFGQAILYAAGRLGMDEPEGLVLTVEGSQHREKFQLGGLTVTIEAKASREDLEAMTEMAKSYCFVSNSLACPVRHVVIARS